MNGAVSFWVWLQEQTLTECVALVAAIGTDKTWSGARMVHYVRCREHFMRSAYSSGSVAILPLVWAEYIVDSAGESLRNLYTVVDSKTGHVVAETGAPFEGATMAEAEAECVRTYFRAFTLAPKKCGAFLAEYGVRLVPHTSELDAQFRRALQSPYVRTGLGMFSRRALTRLMREVGPGKTYSGLMCCGRPTNAVFECASCGVLVCQCSNPRRTRVCDACAIIDASAGSSHRSDNSPRRVWDVSSLRVGRARKR